MKIKGTTAGLTFIVIFVGGIILSQAAGYWATESSKEPMKFETGAFAGEANPADIRGSYSLGDIERAFDIPVATLAQAFAMSGEENQASIQVKVFEELFGIIDGKEIGTDSMRLFVSLYKGIPYVTEEDTGLPRPALSILRKEGAMTAEELAAAEERLVSMDSVHVDVSAIPDDDHSKDVLKEIKGKTMFSDLYDWGLTQEEVEKILGMPAGVRTQTVRDFCMEKGIEFSTVKTPIQELLDSK